jgi:flagellar basal-body rod protein FlgB
MNILNTASMRLLEKSLNAASLRQRVIANNIANAETPNYQRSYVRFEDALAEAINPPTKLGGTRTDSKHMPIGADRSKQEPSIEVLEDTSLTMNNNGNNVDIEYEMAQMAKNSLRYNLLIQRMNGEFRSLRSVIDGR